MVFLEISQNSKENTCARVPFLINLQSSSLQLYVKWLLLYLWLTDAFISMYHARWSYEILDL